MNSARHKCLAVVAKTHFASREARPLGVLFWVCGLYLSLFWVLADPLGMLLQGIIFLFSREYSPLKIKLMVS
jgi:hypothetical protein